MLKFSPIQRRFQNQIRSISKRWTQFKKTLRTQRLRSLWRTTTTHQILKLKQETPSNQSLIVWYLSHPWCLRAVQTSFTICSNLKLKDGSLKRRSTRRIWVRAALAFLLHVILWIETLQQALLVSEITIDVKIRIPHLCRVSAKKTQRLTRWLEKQWDLCPRRFLSLRKSTPNLSSSAKDSGLRRSAAPWSRGERCSRGCSLSNTRP